MHMARLWDTSRDKATGGGGGEGYSLESLSYELIKNPKFTKVDFIYIYVFFFFYPTVLYIISIKICKKNIYLFIYLFICLFVYNKYKQDFHEGFVWRFKEFKERRTLESQGNPSSKRSSVEPHT